MCYYLLYMIIHSHSKVGQEELEENEGALIGLSIRNSYFKDKNLHQLITWAKDNFNQVHIMCPDVPAIDTLKSLGYPDNKARLKATLACNNLMYKCQRICEKLNIDAHFIRWADVENQADYQNMYLALKKLYLDDPTFHSDVRETTREVIQNHGTKLPINKAIDIGIEFFLKEIAFIINAADILGIPKSTYLYHKEMPVLQKLLDSKYYFTPPANTGYIICETEQ